MKKYLLFLTMVCAAAIVPSTSLWAWGCSSAVDLTCGQEKWYSGNSRDDFSLLKQNMSSCSGSSWAYNGKDRLFRFDAGHDKKSITIKLSGMSKDLDLFVYKTCSNRHHTSKLTNCLARSVNSGSRSETIKINNPRGVYYILVDAFSSSVRSGYDIEVTCVEKSNDPPATTCHNAKTLRCGENKWVDKPTGNSINRNNMDTRSCGYRLNYEYKGRDDVYKIDVGSSKKKITITLNGLSADLDMFLFKKCESSYGGAKYSSCVDMSYNSGRKSEKIVVNEASGEYYLVIDGFHLWSSSGYDVSLKCEEIESSYSCADATRLRCGENKWVHAPRKNNLDSDNYDMSSCGGSRYSSVNGKDHLYRIDIGNTAKDIKIHMNGLRADMDMYLFKSCGSHYRRTKLSNCVAKSTNSGTRNETISLDNVKGTYYLAVESQSHNASSYDLSLKCETPYQPSVCDQAKPLRCGSNKWVDRPTHNHMSGGNYDMSNCWNRSYAYSGRDHLYRIDLGSTPQDVVIKMNGLRADLDLFLFRHCRDAYSQSKLSSCVAKSINSYNRAETITLSGATGTYYLAVDGYNSAQNCGYDISLHCTPVQQNYGCEIAKNLSCGSNIWEEAPTENHFDASQYSRSGCSSVGGQYSGKDRLYKINVGNESRNLKIRMSGLRANMDMFLYRKCESSYGETKFEQCIDHSTKSGNSTELITVADAKGTYYLIVDSKSAYHNSSYDLSVSCTRVPDNPACEAARELSCGDEFRSSNYHSNSNATDIVDRHTGCRYNSGYSNREVIFAVNGGANGLEDVKIRVKSVSAGANFDIFAYENCSTRYSSYYSNWRYTMSDLIACSQDFGSSRIDEITLDRVAPNQEIFVVVDLRRVSNWTAYKGAFEISMTCGEEEEEEHPEPSCMIHDELTCGNSIMGTTENKPNTIKALSGDCAGTSVNDHRGGDQLYSFVAEEAGDYTVSLLGMTGDLDLFILEGCLDESKCITSSITTGSQSETLEVSFSEGQEVYILVDSRKASYYSSFELSINCPGAMAIPNNCITISESFDGEYTAQLIDTDCEDTEVQVVYYDVDDEENGEALAFNMESENTITFEPEYVAGTQEAVKVIYSFQCEGNTDRTVCELVTNLSPSLACGDTYIGSTVGGSSRFDDNAIESCFSSTFDFAGPDQLIRFTKSNTEPVEITLNHTGGDNLSMFILDEDFNVAVEACKASNFTAKKLISNSGPIGEYFTDRNNPLPAGNYYILIDGFASSIASDFEVTLECSGGNVTPIDTTQCEEMRMSPGAVNNLSAYRSGNKTYAGYTGNEQVIALNMEEGERNYTVSLIGGEDSDLDFFLMNTALDTIYAYGVSDNSNEHTTVTLPAGMYFIVVDSWLSDMTDFEFDVDGCSINVADGSTARSRTAPMVEVQSALVKSYPNPFSNQLNLQVDVEQAAQGILNIYGLDGSLLYNSSQRLQKGKNEWTIEGSELNDYTGVMYYNILIDDRSHYGRVVRVK